MSDQPPPSATQDLSNFPAGTLENHAHVHRAHNPTNGPCYFSSGPQGGRFDLMAPLGTCYVADDPETAVREKVRGQVFSQEMIPATYARTFVLTELLTDHAFHAANVSAREAARCGVTRMLTTMGDYDVPQKWAAALHESGFEAIRYASRYTTGPENSWGLFGDAGEHAFATAISTVRGVAACQSAGIRVYETPHSLEIQIIDGSTDPSAQ